MAERGETGVAVVTGASSGLGRATAVEFARAGYAVVLAARREERLRETASLCAEAGDGAPTLVVPTDVASEAQVEALVAATLERFGRLDVLVNNAGFGVSARVHETDPQDMRDLFAVNFFGVYHACRAAAPVMMRQRSGHIFNISSVLGKRGGPLSGAYSASKFAVCGLTQAMRVEMMPYNVRLTCVCPGTTDTEFFDHVRGRSRRGGSSFRRVRGMTPPRKVARKIVRTVGRNRPELVFSLAGKLLVFVNARWPRLADRMMKVYHDDLVRGMDLPDYPPAKR
jgi:NAD(P)-dependent dehydrogenase (short-subunit alcohol dehydrogenase family)